MIALDVGNTEKASQIAAQGQIALNEGDTARAQSLFRAAAEELERQIAGVRKQGDKHMLRFLAASQYYHGGLYADAQRLCRRVEVRLLPTEVRPTFQHFFRDVNERADPGYKRKIRESLLRHRRNKDSQGILDLLQRHPYVLPQFGVAFIRATSFERIKDYKAAAVFFADTIRFAPDAPEVLFTSIALPIVLMQDVNLDEAWEYIRYQLQTIPHALTSINASLLRYRQAGRAASDEERRTLSEEQIRYFEDAWQRFQFLPPTIQSHSEICGYMVLGFEAAAFAYLRLDRSDAARDLCDRTIALFPNLPGPYTIRGIVTYPAPQAIDDFKEAIRLGDTGHTPANYLAHAAAESDGAAENRHEMPVQEAGERYLSEPIPTFRRLREEVVQSLELVGT